MFEKYTAYQPVHTTMTTATWSGWRTVNPRCLGCANAVMRGATLACMCASRTLRHGPEGDSCMSYREREAGA